MRKKKVNKEYKRNTKKKMKERNKENTQTGLVCNEM